MKSYRIVIKNGNGYKVYNSLISADDETEAIKIAINDLIYQANHTSDFKRWQKITAQINVLKERL